MKREKLASQSRVGEIINDFPAPGPGCHDGANGTGRFHQLAIFLLLYGLFAVPAASEEGGPEVKPFSELKQMSLEELASYKVTSVSKREELLSEAASAIQVITSEEIRRSGATSIR